MNIKFILQHYRELPIPEFRQNNTKVGSRARTSRTICAPIGHKRYTSRTKRIMNHDVQSDVSTYLKRGNNAQMYGEKLKE